MREEVKLSAQCGIIKAHTRIKISRFVNSFKDKWKKKSSLPTDESESGVVAGAAVK